MDFEGSDLYFNRNSHVFRLLHCWYKQDCHSLDIFNQAFAFNDTFAPWELLLRGFRTGKASGAHTVIAQLLKKQSLPERPPETETAVGGSAEETVIQNACNTQHI